MKRTAGGRFDPGEETIYFLAGSAIKPDMHPWTLVAVNDFANEGQTVSPGGKATQELEERLAAGNKVILDSGVFWLANRHRQRHGITHTEALGLAPDSIDGFEWLWENYLTLAKHYEKDLWGYIELDQGGATNKRITRAKLEREGLAPIPVYHPINDGWAYFDELAAGYDRICMGNVVQANQETRKHLLATLWERRRRYPDLWVHVLGLTPNEVITAYPSSSCDSSSWVYAVRYGAHSAPGAHAMGDSFGRFETTFSYDPAEDSLAMGGQERAVRFLSAEASFMQRAIRDQERDLMELFGEDALLPPFDPTEGVRA